MQQSEYERRRRALEKQYEEDLELIRTAHHAKLRALEMAWLGTSATEPAPAQRPVAAAPGEPHTAGETQKAGESQAPVEPRGPRAKASPKADRGGLKQAIRDALPRLPAIFRRQDLEAALGFTPPRSTLIRVLREMWWTDKELEIVEHSEGRRPTRYRKTAPRQEGR